MTFQDILKSSFLENLSTFSFLDAAIALFMAFAVGVFIHTVYKKTFSGVLYNDAFNTSLVLLTMLTTFVILAVTSNVVLSLGMVGALSIVRFRTAIKDPLDLVFLFWAIGVGIVLGAGLLPLALLGSFLIGLVLLLFVRGHGEHLSYLLLLHVSDESVEVETLGILKKETKKMSVKSKTVHPGEIELIYELQLKTKSTAFINELGAISGVEAVTLMPSQGELSA